MFKFDWLELCGYVIPYTFQSLDSYSPSVKSPYFFLFFVILPVLDLYALMYTKKHSVEEERIREKEVGFLILLDLFFCVYWIEHYSILKFMSRALSHYYYVKILLTTLTIWLSSE